MMNKTWEERLLETEKLTRERQRDFAEIGVCVADGIKIQKDRFYLVNLNADPSMNELLVYYINVSFPKLIDLLNYILFSNAQ